MSYKDEQKNKKVWRYVVKSAKGGKLDRFYVWDSEKNRVYKGMMTKNKALRLEKSLNGRLKPKARPFALPN